MELFLIIVAGMFVGFLVIVLAIYLFVRFWLRRMVKGFVDLGQEAFKGIVPFMQPLRIKLRRERKLHWDDGEAIDSVVKPLRTAGFQDAGAYTIDESPDFKILALAQPEKAVYSVIYEHPDKGIWFEFVSRYEDGGSLTYSTSPQTGLDRPPNKAIERFDPTIEPTKLYQQHVSLRSPDGLAPATVENFKADFERAYAEEMDWRFERGGFTETEIRSTLKLAHNEAADDKVKQVHAMQQLQVHQWLQTKLKENFRAKVNAPAAKWRKVEDRLIFIHDRLTGEEVFAVFTGFLDWEDDDEAEVRSENAEKQSQEGTAREAFARMIQTLPANRKIKRVGHLEEPVAADVYLAPDDSSPEEDE